MKTSEKKNKEKKEEKFSSNKSDKEKKSCKSKKESQRMSFLLLFAAVAIMTTLALLIVGSSINNTSRKGTTSTAANNEIKKKIEKFINEVLIQSDQKATIKEITEEENLYKAVINTGDNRSITFYFTKDGKTFFPRAIDMEEMKKQKEKEEERQKKEEEKQKAEMTKKDKPEVELFVMSYCPYGAQIEKGLLPVLETLGDKIDFKLKFCDYAMHGKKEVDENLRQYCIQKEEPDKLQGYLKCFLEAGKSEECIKKTGIDSAKLSACVSSTDEEYKVTEKYNDKSSWINNRFPPFDVYKKDNEKYGVKGSPTLVINGKRVSVRRDPQSLLDMICSGFNNPPEECSKKLSSVAFSPGFGFNENSNTAGASCNN